MSDTAVLLIFFNRPNTFKAVFSQVRKAKPNKLYLFQDGARDESDKRKMQICRKIAEGVDWECEIHTNYQSENLGCGQGPYQAISWVLNNEESAIILEDDCVPDISFFDYCDELLKKYKNDTRIGMITGFNHFGSWDCGNSSYFFGKTGANCGWATWRRVWEEYDYNLKALDDVYYKQKLKDVFLSKHISKYVVRRLLRTKQKIAKSEKLSYWDLQLEGSKYLNSWLCIIPKVNLISNVGFGEDATHNANKSPFNEITVGRIDKIIHPQCIIQDIAYDKKYYSITCPNYFVMIKNKVLAMCKR